MLSAFHAVLGSGENDYTPCCFRRYIVQWQERVQMDTLTTAERSERMSRVRSKDTKPEMLVRSLVHRMGFRYRLHDRSLPGNPDMVFPSRGKIILCTDVSGADVEHARIQGGRKRNWADGTARCSYESSQGALC